MGKMAVREEAFPEIVERYNNEGKTATYDFIRSRYGVKHPANVMNRIKKCGAYTYDQDTDHFSAPELESAGVFMDLDELCGGTSIKPVQLQKRVPDSRPEAMEKLIHELISDRLLALSRYITLDTSTRTILIDQTSMSADGFHIVTH